MPLLVFPRGAGYSLVDLQARTRRAPAPVGTGPCAGTEARLRRRGRAHAQGAALTQASCANDVVYGQAGHRKPLTSGWTLTRGRIEDSNLLIYGDGC